ncbi:MAG: sugar O-acetyltransferase [Roseobacter sp.]|jgi:maltose O-acetyltransferase|nr:sugar O-acetyltransferase [Roseobacter sp.]
MTSEKTKMCAGELYHPGDNELARDRARSQDLQRRYNQTTVADREERAIILEAWFGSVGAGTNLRAPLYADYGYNIDFGRDAFCNYGCVLLDVCPIRIGDMTQIGPYVQILTADHPRDAATRDQGLEFGQPITIGRNVWIGGGALILPGVSIGDDAVIGAGAIVTRSVSAGTTVAGNPARPLVRKANSD